MSGRPASKTTAAPKAPRERKKYVINTGDGPSVEAISKALSADEAALVRERASKHLGLPDPIDFSTFAGTDADTLAVLEKRIRDADQALNGSVQSAQARYVVVVGTTLRYIAENNTHAVTGLPFKKYVSQTFRISPRRTYQLMEAALDIQDVVEAGILPAVNESQAVTVAPYLRAHGREATAALVRDIEAAGRKVTAERLNDAIQARQLPGMRQQLQLEAGAVGEPARDAEGAGGEPEVLDAELVENSALTDTELRKAVARRSLELADTLGRGRITPAEIQRALAEAFIDGADPRVYKALLSRMRTARN